MALVDFLILLCIAGVCGSIGSAFAGRSRSGFLVNIALGFIGAIFGVWVAHTFDLPTVFVTGLTGFPVIWSIIGSALFVAVVNVFSRRNPDLLT